MEPNFTGITVFELIKNGGWLMLSIILCSIIATAIVVERFWSLRRNKILSSTLIPHIYTLIKQAKLDSQTLKHIQQNSPFGEIMVVGLINRQHGREIMKNSIENTGRQIVHKLERIFKYARYFTSITPLLGLLGTVVGMVKVFTAITIYNANDFSTLAGGIAEALIATVAGLTVAIPSLIFYRYFERLIEKYVVDIETEALRLIEVWQDKINVYKA